MRQKVAKLVPMKAPKSYFAILVRAPYVARLVLMKDSKSYFAILVRAPVVLQSGLLW